MDLSLYSKGELANSLERAKAIAKKAREVTKVTTERTVQSALTYGAGYATGLARNKLGSGGKLLIPGTPVEADLAAAVILTAAGVMGLAGEKSPELLAIGNGVGAGYMALLGLQNGLPGEGR